MGKRRLIPLSMSCVVGAVFIAVSLTESAQVKPQQAVPPAKPQQAVPLKNPIHHEVCDRHNDVATASLIEVWIDEAERRIWFLSEVIRES
jgi:hypothetical protein